MNLANSFSLGDLNLLTSAVILRFFTDKNPNKKLIDLFTRIERGGEEAKCVDKVFFQAIFVLKSFYKVEKKK